MINYLRIGKIISLHGIKGEVKVFATTDDVKRFDKLKKFYLSNLENANDFDEAKYFEMSNVKYFKNSPIMKIVGFDSIEDSTKLIGKNIYVSRSDSVELKENEFFVMDLIGLSVELNGKVIGKVKEIMKTKANDIFTFDFEGKEILVPMVNDFIKEIDVKNSKIIISTIEGLL